MNSNNENHTSIDPTCFFLKIEGGEALFTRWYIPKKEVNATCIICPPIGYEYSHSYRSLRRLAETLAHEGNLVVIFDYLATGSSTGTPFYEHLPEQWINNITAISAHIFEHYPELPQTWLGLRTGATLALLASAKSPKQIDLVVWEAIDNGRAYVRELKATSQLSTVEQNTDDKTLESAGFLFSKQTIDYLSQIKISKLRSAFNIGTVLNIKREEAGGRPLDLILKEQSHSYEHVRSPGYDNMMDLPHRTEIPTQEIDKITQMLRSKHSSINKQAIKIPANLQHIQVKVCDIYIEEICCRFDNKSLFGLLSQPSTDSENHKKCIIFANAGAVHHAGPNNVYTEVARALAAKGISVFRFDQINLGDSRIKSAEEENHPYQSEASNNIASAIQYLSSNYPLDEFVVGGICSGAHAAFQFPMERPDIPVSGLALINPLTFYWHPGLSLTPPPNIRSQRDGVHYANSLKSLDRWKKLLSGKANIRYILKFLINKIKLSIGQQWRSFQVFLLGEKSQLSKDLKVICERTPVYFIFADSDPGLEIVNNQARYTLNQLINDNRASLSTLSNADHTFSTYESRQKLIKILSSNFVD